MYFHGTNISGGTAILSEQKMNPSRGDNHWLGDGCYFFDNDFYAFRWVVIDYTGNFTNNKQEKIDDIFDYYMILKAYIKLSSDRIYSLSDPIMHINYLNLLELLKQKQEYSERFKNTEIVDGVVINILFEDMGYKNNYDAITGVFPIKTKQKNKSRFNSFSEFQICIKNADIISRIEMFNDKTVPKKYKEIIKKYNEIKFGNTNIINKHTSKSKYKPTNTFTYKYK